MPRSKDPHAEQLRELAQQLRALAASHETPPALTPEEVLSLEMLLAECTLRAVNVRLHPIVSNNWAVAGRNVAEVLRRLG